MRVEYKIEHLESYVTWPNEIAAHEAKLNQLAAEGWRLVAIKNEFAYLERDKMEPR